MTDKWNRTEMILGSESICHVINAKIIIFGIGGVGSYVAEALARSGVGFMTLVDNDVVSKSNINRQLVALESTIGLNKVDVASARIKDINPLCNITVKKAFFCEETKNAFNLSEYDYIVDAIDSVSSKMLLIKTASDNGTPIISCMGTGNKLDPTALEIADIYQTSVCPLAKVVRHECKLQGIEHLKVVYSKEKPVQTGTRTPGSVPWVPSVAGLIMAGEVIKDLINE